MACEEEMKERAPKRRAEHPAEEQSQGEDAELEEQPDIHLGWLHAARGEQDDRGLKQETLEMGHVINVTDGDTDRTEGYAHHKGQGQNSEPRGKTS